MLSNIFYLYSFYGFLVVVATNLPDDTIILKEVITADDIPLEFPTNNSKYNLVTNATNLKILTGKVTAIEVDDLLHGGLYSNISHHNETEINRTSLITDPISDTKENKLSDRTWDTELIEDGTNTEDEEIEKRNSDRSDDILIDNNYQLTAVLAGFIIIIIVVGSVAFIFWRKFEHRYRKRELLVNEDDPDPDDMRNFSI